MKYILSLIVALIIGVSTGWGQITYYGQLVDFDSKGSLNGATIRVLDNKKQIASVATSGGKYTIQFPPGKVYTIEYSKPGYVTKIIRVDVREVFEEDMPPGGKIFPPINIDLFTDRPGADFNFLKTEPVVQWTFDNDRMVYNERQAAAMKKKIADKLEEASQNAGNHDAEYNALIQEADQLFNSKEYENALAKYSAALQVPGKQTEAHPSNRIVEIGDLLQKQAEEELSYQQENQAYFNLIEAADNFAKNKEYTKAIAKYKEASQLNSKEQYPKDRINELQEIVDNEKKREQYDEQIKRGDMFLKQNSLEAARDRYQEASKLLPHEQYPKDQLQVIAERLDAQSEIRERREKYEKAVADGDKAFDKEEFETAIEKYKEALTYESAADYPQARIGMAEGKLAEILAEKEKQENFERLVKEGDENVTGKEYALAIEKYNEALGLFDKAEVVTKRNSAQQLLEAQEANAEKQAAFDALVADADAKVEAKEFATAIEKYTEALALIDDTEVINKRNNAQQLLAEHQANAEKQEAFDALVADADAKVGSGEYTEAIEKYSQALALIDQDDVRQKRQNAEQLRAEKQAGEEKQANFDALVADGDQKVQNEEYATAIVKYEEALALIDDAGVKAKRDQAQQLMADKQAAADKQTQFNALVDEADQKVAQKDYTTAISKYNEALALIDDAGVKGKRDAAQQKMEEEAANAERNSQIASLLADAEGKMSAKDYAGALEKFTSVLGLEAQHPEALAGKARAEQYLADAEEMAAKEAQFEALVAQADAAFGQNDLEDARTKYLAAKNIFGDRTHVNQRIEEINSALQQAADKQRRDEDIQVLLDQASNLKMDNKWGQVVQKYEEALELDNSRTDIATLLAEAKNSKAEWDAAQSQDQLFDQLKTDGLTFMASQRWNEAKTKFEEALQVKADSEISAYLTQIESELANQSAAQAQEAAYQAKMNEGESFAGTQEYQKALTSFQEALAIKENDAIAMSKIADMQQKIEMAGAQAEKDARYTAAMNEGRSALENKDYSAAIKAFDDALLEKPLDTEANRLKEEARNKIKSLQSEEERYENFLTEGETLLQQAKAAGNAIPTLESAKEKFREAQKMRPEASQPQNKIVEIDELLRQIEEELAERNKEANEEQAYQEKLQLANVAAQNRNYARAIDHLNEALGIRPNSQYPKDKIEEYKGLMANMEADAEVENRYQGFIQQADLAFDNKNYEQSINLYEKALGVKPNESYPTSQIERARKGIQDLALSSVDQKYQSFINEADQNYSNKRYENALVAYESALGVKPNDSYARDRVSEVKQILKNQQAQSELAAANQAKYDGFIREADALFDNEDFVAAKKAYDNALGVKPNDVYANERSQLSVIKSREKTEKEDDALYHKIVEKADDYFNQENYERAIDLYKRAITLRSYDRYPQDKIDEILAIQNANVKANADIEYLGVQANISIIEGAALLEAGERQREQIKRTSIEQQLVKNEGLEKDFTEKDLIERHAYQNEIISLRDRRDAIYFDEHVKHRVYIDFIDEHVKAIDLQKNRLDNYEVGDVYRSYKNIDYIEIGMEEVNQNYLEDHLLTVERIKDVEVGRDQQVRAEVAVNEVKVETIAAEILETVKKNENLDQVNIEKQRDLEVKVDDILKGRELRVFEESNDLYEKIVKLESDALIAELRTEDSKENKQIIHQQLQDDIYALDASLQRKGEREVDGAISTQMELDGQVLLASIQYATSQEGKDDARQMTVERLKAFDKEQADQLKVRGENHYVETQNIHTETVRIDDLRNEGVIDQEKDLAKIAEEVKSQERRFDSEKLVRDEDKLRKRNQTVDELERIVKTEEMLKDDNAKKPSDNYESVKGLNASVDGREQETAEFLKNRRYKTQQVLEQLEKNQLTYTELIANTIGDEYPEGVSQENYIRKDDKGIPVQIVTRRFVVQNGHGDIYIRIQTRNGLTYSKNGTPITEQGWINGTENAKLQKHF